MQGEYICDDRGVIENIERIRNMTEEEFEEYIKQLKEDAANDR